MTDWIRNEIQAAIYAFLKSIAQLTWGLDKAGLSVIELLDRFRLGLVQQGFTNALDTIAVEVIGLSRPVFELTLVAALLLIIIAPMIKLRWFDIRKVLLYAVLIPLLLPTVAAGFQDIDALRGDLGSHFYTSIFSRTDFDLVPEGQPTGQTRDMGPLVPYGPRSDGQTGLRGVDVAAAYLFATREDVVNAPDRLPLAFKERYFRYTPEELENAPDAWAEIDTASEGITRSLYGFIIIVFAFLETVVNLGFTLTLGFLLVTLLLSILFAFAAPFEGLMISTIQNIVQLFMQSWAVSAMQALTLAAVIDIAENGNGTQVLGAGLLGLLLEMMWVMLAYRSVLSAIGGLSLGGSSGAADASRVLAPLRRTVGSAVETAGSLVTAPGRAGAALVRAGGAGALAGLRAGSAGYGVGVALGTSGPLAKMGALATMMGFMPAESAAGRGLYTSGVISQGQPLSPRGLRAIERDAALVRTEQRTSPGQIGAAVIAAALTPSAVPANVRAAAALGLRDGAFGINARKVDRLAAVIGQRPLPAPLLGRLLTETREEGGFRATTRAQAMEHLQITHQMDEGAADQHLSGLEASLRGMPTAIRPEDRQRWTADELAPVPLAITRQAPETVHPFNAPIIPPDAPTVRNPGGVPLRNATPTTRLGAPATTQFSDDWTAVHPAGAPVIGPEARTVRNPGGVPLRNAPPTTRLSAPPTVPLPASDTPLDTAALNPKAGRLPRLAPPTTRLKAPATVKLREGQQAPPAHRGRRSR